MDRAPIFTEITKRNELRRKAQLPLLNLRAEMAHAEALAALQEYRGFCEQHWDTLEQFRAEVLGEMRERNPNFFGHSLGGRLAVHFEACRRFEAWVEETFGVVKPYFVGRNAIVYGADRDKQQG